MHGAPSTLFPTCRFVSRACPLHLTCCARPACCAAAQHRDLRVDGHAAAHAGALCMMCLLHPRCACCSPVPARLGMVCRCWARRRGRCAVPACIAACCLPAMAPSSVCSLAGARPTLGSWGWRAGGRGLACQPQAQLAMGRAVVGSGHAPRRGSALIITFTHLLALVPRSALIAYLEAQPGVEPIHPGSNPATWCGRLSASAAAQLGLRGRQQCWCICC